MSLPSAAFCPPPLDGSLTIDGIYHWHSIRSPDRIAFSFPHSKDVLDRPRKSLSWKELGDGIATGMDIIEKHIPETQSSPSRQPSAEDQRPIVVGILASLDTITHTTFLFSHIRLTHRTSTHSLLPFVISPLTHHSFVSHLARKTGMKYLWFSEGPMKEVVDEAFSQGGLSGVTVLRMPSFFQLFPPSGTCTRTRSWENISTSLEVPALILHTSGTTSLPKPLTLTHQILLQRSKIYGQAGLESIEEIIPTHGSLICHGFGLSIALLAATTGYIRAAPCPFEPVHEFTPKQFWEEIVASGSTILIIVPKFLEAWSNSEQIVEKLKYLKAIFYGGCVLNTEIGELLREKGAPIHNMYGSTESGTISLMEDETYHEGPEWFKFAKHVTPVFVPESGGRERVFELVIKETVQHRIAALNSEIDGAPAFAMNDLIEQHSTNPSLFRILGRKDDVIPLSMGDNANPARFESTVTKDSLVKSAVMFGSGRAKLGVLIEPESYDMAERLGSEAFIALVWPAIEAANGNEPAYIRITKEMVIITSRTKPFEYTLKHTVRRGAVIKSYSLEIDAAYVKKMECLQLGNAEQSGM